MGSHTASLISIKNFLNVPFSNTIKKIGILKSKIIEQTENHNNELCYENNIEELDKMLMLAYEELANSAKMKTIDWKDGPILRTISIEEKELII